MALPARTLASEADRERCAQALREAHAAGRIDHEELEERLALVVAARTSLELRAARRGLPLTPPRPAPGMLGRLHRAALGLHAAAYTGANGTAVGVWALAGEGFFWPAILLVPTTGLLAAHAASGPVVRRAWHRAKRRAEGR